MRRQEKAFPSSAFPLFLTAIYQGEVLSFLTLLLTPRGHPSRLFDSISRNNPAGRTSKWEDWAETCPPHLAVHDRRHLTFSSDTLFTCLPSRTFYSRALSSFFPTFVLWDLLLLCFRLCLFAYPSDSITSSTPFNQNDGSPEVYSQGLQCYISWA